MHFLHTALLHKTLYSKGNNPPFVYCTLQSNSEMSLAFPSTLT